MSSPKGEAVRAEADAALEAESVKHLLVPQVYDDYVVDEAKLGSPEVPLIFFCYGLPCNMTNPQKRVPFIKMWLLVALNPKP